jgi:two-component system phosphate regulon sensor histidine kinase PhoR
MSREIDDASRKFVERIYNECKRLNSLIMDMLKLSNLERNLSEDIKMPVELFDISNEVKKELKEQAEKKKITTNIIGKGEILADRNKIYEIIENLYSNAINYNVENGKIEIKISENENSVTLIVKDTGIGIPKEHINRLCERFYRVDKSRSKSTGGTGLGLAIVKHICAIYNAQLSIESEVNKGTTVTVVFNKDINS